MPIILLVVDGATKPRTGVETQSQHEVRIAVELISEIGSPLEDFGLVFWL